MKGRQRSQEDTHLSPKFMSSVSDVSNFIRKASQQKRNKLVKV